MLIRNIQLIGYPDLERMEKLYKGMGCNLYEKPRPKAINRHALRLAKYTAYAIMTGALAFAVSNWAERGVSALESMAISEANE